jgi:hypothetical protein
MPEDKKNYTLEEISNDFASQEALRIQEQLITSAAEGILQRKQELLEEVKGGGAIHLDTAMANAIADESIRQAREQLSQEVGNVVMLPSEIKVLDRVAKSNLEAIAGVYFPEAYNELEKRKSQLSRRALGLKAKTRRVERREARTRKAIEDLKNYKKNEWRLKLWFWKELTSNIIVLQVFLIIGVLLGIFAGVQIPDAVGCRKDELCAFLRIKDKQLY